MHLFINAIRFAYRYLTLSVNVSFDMRFKHIGYDAAIDCAYNNNKTLFTKLYIYIIVNTLL